MVEPKKYTKKTSKDPKKKNQKNNNQEDDSSEYSDIYDSEGYIDDKDREILLQKTEKERESILYDRNQRREELKKKKKLEREQTKTTQELLKKVQDGKNPKKQALDELTLKRKLQLNEKTKKPQSKTKYSNESSPASSNEDDERDSGSEYQEDSSKREEDDETQKFSKKNDGSKKKVNITEKTEEKSFELKHIEKIRLTRHMLEKMISQPNFEKTVKGCFVRLSVSSERNKRNYVIAEIVDVLENPKFYKIDIKETKKVLLLRHADKEKKFEITFVSNGKFETPEFANWQVKMDEKKIPLPTFQQIEDKMKDINEALNYQYDEEEVTDLLKKKIDTNISVNSPSNKDLTAEINYFSQRLGTLEYDLFISKSYESKAQNKEKKELKKNPEKLEQEIKEIKEKLAILKEKNRKYHEGSKKRDVFEEAMMKKMFGAYLNKKSNSKKPISKKKNEGDIMKNITSPKKYKSLDDKLKNCANAKEYESIKEEFLEIFQKNFSFENEIENYVLEEGDIL